MKKLKIFISSVQNEFASERKELASYLRHDPLLSSFFEPFLFEEVPATAHFFTLDEGFKLTIWKPSADTEHDTEHDTIHDTVHDTIHESIHNVAETYTELAELAHRLVLVIQNEMSRVQLMEILELKNRSHFAKNYLDPALSEGLIEMTLPDKSKSKKQKYKLTTKGEKLKQLLQNERK